LRRISGVRGRCRCERRHRADQETRNKTSDWSHGSPTRPSADPCCRRPSPA
jgi:hypothetical protein